ncbi:MAG: hypothetical protein R6X20_16450 [Phycisphaerae bacterium]
MATAGATPERASRLMNVCRRAWKFLDEKPPLFFRQRVLDALEAGDGIPEPKSLPGL